MQDHELDAWLGDARRDLTDEQYARLVDEAQEIARRYPDRDDRDDAVAALTGALQYLLGETTPTAAGTALVTARLAASQALATARQVARMAARDGAPKATTARAAGIDRMTLLKDLGERGPAAR